MAEIPYFIRYKEVTTLDDSDSLFLDDATSDVPKKIAFSDFKVGLPSASVAWGDVTGTLSDQTDLQNALDEKQNLLVAYAEKTANYTITSNDFTINCTANSFTITLPTAVGITGRCFEITNTGSGVITLDADGSETIQGDLTQLIYQDECFVIRSTGANWIVI
jgi:hypothetical protein